MEKTIEIPEGYEARIEGNKVILEPKESEDERIRKMLIEQMIRWEKCAEENNVEQDIKDASDALAYLERQKEQKPASGNSEKPNNHVEWSEEDDALLKEIVSFFKDGTIKLQHDLDLYAGFLENKFKSLRPSWKPSEEQRHIEGQDTCYLNKQKLVNFIEDCIAENLENTTQENRDNHEGYHQACWDILYFIKQASK